VIVATVPVNAGTDATEAGVVVVGASVVVVVEIAVVVLVVADRVVDVAGVVGDLDCCGPVLSVPDDPHAPVVTRMTTANAPTRRWSCTAS